MFHDDSLTPRTLIRKFMEQPTPPLIAQPQPSEEPTSKQAKGELLLQSRGDCDADYRHCRLVVIKSFVNTLNKYFHT